MEIDNCLDCVNVLHCNNAGAKICDKFELYWYDVRDVAKACNISIRTLYRYMAKMGKKIVQYIKEHSNIQDIEYDNAEDAEHIFLKRRNNNER